MGGLGSWRIEPAELVESPSQRKIGDGEHHLRRAGQSQCRAARFTAQRRSPCLACIRANRDGRRLGIRNRRQNLAIVLSRKGLVELLDNRIDQAGRQPWPSPSRPADHREAPARAPRPYRGPAQPGRPAVAQPGRPGAAHVRQLGRSFGRPACHPGQWICHNLNTPSESRLSAARLDKRRPTGGVRLLGSWRRTPGRPTGPGSDPLSAKRPACAHRRQKGANPFSWVNSPAVHVPPPRCQVVDRPRVPCRAGCSTGGEGADSCGPRRQLWRRRTAIGPAGASGGAPRPGRSRRRWNWFRQDDSARIRGPREITQSRRSLNRPGDRLTQQVDESPNSGDKLAVAANTGDFCGWRDPSASIGARRPARWSDRRY